MTWLQSSAFVLAKRPFSEFKEIWEFFSEHYGRLALIVPLSRRYRTRDYGQCLDIAWRPGATLPTLRTLELQRCFGVFSADTGIFILYLNELIRSLLPEAEAHPKLFQYYMAAIQALIATDKTQEKAHVATVKPAEWILRRFELLLLEDLGFALPLEKTQEQQIVSQDFLYHWHIPEGIRHHAYDLEISGQVLRFLAAWRYSPEPSVVLSAAQWQMLNYLLRATLAHYLAGKPLQTRKLWQLLHP